MAGESNISNMENNPNKEIGSSEPWNVIFISYIFIAIFLSFLLMALLYTGCPTSAAANDLIFNIKVWQNFSMQTWLIPKRHDLKIYFPFN